MENLTSSKIVKTLLDEKGMSPNKRLGQNFLTDKRALDKILEAADLSPQDTVVEIGPGLGMLTKALAEKVRKVVAIEKDPKMVEVLKETLKQYRNIELIQGDILKHEIRSTKSETLRLRSGQANSKIQIPKNYKLVANLPYYITSPVIRKFLEAKHKPKLMVLMVQKEVAQRICAKPRTRTSSVRGRPPMNLLAVSVQFYGEPKIVSYVSKNSFWPVPEVDSAIIKITPIAADTNADARGFFTIVRAGFKQPRKQLVNNLSKGLGLKRERVAQWLKKNNLNPAQRAETLSLQDWIHLVKSAII